MIFSIVKNFSYNSTMLFLFLLFLGTSSFAQPASSDYKAGNEGWLVNLDEAHALSKKTGKPILANFTGSDWCGYCIKLTRLVFSKEDFKEWAKENVILLELDFPKRIDKRPASIKQQNENLQQAFRISGYPTIWVFDLEKNTETNQYSITALGKTGFTETSKQFINDIESMIAQRE